MARRAVLEPQAHKAQLELAHLELQARRAVSEPQAHKEIQE